VKRAQVFVVICLREIDICWCAGGSAFRQWRFAAYKGSPASIPMLK
jgi:hypothetical protein